MNIPSTIIAGDSLSWNDGAGVDSAGIALRSPTWTLIYYLRTNTAAEGATVTGATDGAGGWNFTIAAATTTNFDAGAWYWQAKATSGASVITLGTGSLTVKASLAYSATPGAIDGRSQAARDLEAVQAAIRTIIAGGVTQYMIGNRQATKIDLAKLVEREAYLKAIVAREKAAEKLAAGLGDSRNLYVRFG
jgi:hypothetical protein